jgi:hypothetical protein
MKLGAKKLQQGVVDIASSCQQQTIKTKQYIGMKEQQGVFQVANNLIATAQSCQKTPHDGSSWGLVILRERHSTDLSPAVACPSLSTALRPSSSRPHS